MRGTGFASIPTRGSQWCLARMALYTLRGSCVAVVPSIGMRGVSSYLNQEGRDSCHGSLARSVFTISHHLAKESPRNDGRMKDASKETLVLAEDLAEQFLGEKLR